MIGSNLAPNSDSLLSARFSLFSYSFLLLLLFLFLFQITQDRKQSKLGSRNLFYWQTIQHQRGPTTGIPFPSTHNSSSRRSS